MNDSYHTNSRRANSSLKQELFPAKQRGFYSDILREEAAGGLQVGTISCSFIVVFLELAELFNKEVLLGCSRSIKGYIYILVHFVYRV